MRRVKLRSVSGNNGSQVAGIAREILCQPGVPDSGKFDRVSNILRHGDCPNEPGVPPRKKLPGGNIPEGPINNFPSAEVYDGGMTDAVTLEIFSLRRRNAELAAKVEGLNEKLTKALECLYSLRRFLQLWINEGQGETFDQVHARIRKMESTIDHIEDRNIGPVPILEVPARWKK